MAEGRVQAALAAIVRALVGNTLVGPCVDYLAQYPAKVVTQNGDGSLELVPDDTRLPTYSAVPIRYGVPGVSAQVAPGARVLLGFAGADPQKPIAELWESASVVSLTVTGATVNLATGTGTIVNIGGATSQVNLGAAAQLVARVGDVVQAGPFAGAITAVTQVTTKA